MFAKYFSIILMAGLLAGAGCASTASHPEQGRTSPPEAESGNPATATDHQTAIDAAPPSSPPGQLPLRFQRPVYQLPASAPAAGLEPAAATMQVPVGADIASATGPVSLRDILRRLASMKKMTLSWASDVDKQALVDVDIRAEDDFFEALGHLLQQQDYYHQVEGNTIQIKYRETRRFHVPIPFMNASYRTGVGGEVQGSGGLYEAGSGNPSNINQILSNNDFDIWENIKENLDQILGIWEETITLSESSGTETAGDGSTTTRRRDVASARGYYTIDKPVGIITVTAPRPLVQQIEEYLDSLKEQLFRQISIEAKIIEVSLDHEHHSGINWAAVLRGKSLDIELFGPDGIIYPSQPNRDISRITIGPNPFELMLEAIESQGETNVLSNPRVSIMNGQPALINVGETIRYIAEVSTNVSEGIISTNVATDTVMSGLSMSVLPIIINDDEIILSMTPVTTQLGEIEERSFSNLVVQLPQISIREMQTMVRVRNGDTLMIGGLIDERESTSNSGVPGLRKLPGLGKFFGHDTRTKQKKELVILLQPRII